MVMKKYTKQLFPVLLTGLLVLCSSNAFAGNEQRSGQAGATELLINPWARSSGWGGINTASIQGLEATFLNVAGLAGTENTEFLFASTSWLFDMQVSAFGFSKALADDAVLGLAISTVSFGEISITDPNSPEGTGSTYSPVVMNIGLSYAKKFTDNISGGATVRMISESTPDMKASGMSLDAGIQYVAGANRQMKFGVSLKNVGPKMKFEGDGNGVKLSNDDAFGQDYDQTYELRSDAFELPSLLNIGASYDFNIDLDSRITVAGNFTSNSFTKDQYGLGLEYGYKTYFMLRTGYVYESGIMDQTTRTTVFTGLNAGFTFEIPLSSGTNFGLDYSFRQASPLASPHTIGARITL